MLITMMHDSRTGSGPGAIDLEEDPAFLNAQLITCLGNKRSLLRFIGPAVEAVARRLNRRRLDVLDLFSGSGVVARFFKQYARRLIVNDLERYSEVINRCYLANRSETDLPLLHAVHTEIVERLRRGPLSGGMITSLYAPKDDEEIRAGERVFYTNRNARYLDTARSLIDTVPSRLRHFLLAPLLSEASVHANTSGVFKGFYKDKSSGIGKFGGRNGDALLRIKGNVELPFPLFSLFDCRTEIHRRDANELVRVLDEVDLAYLDPPYNQHPYGSNYFMLNLIADYRRPKRISRVSGIPDDWSRSQYNSRRCAPAAFEDLIRNIKAKFLLISFNSEGFITRERMVGLLSRYGKVETLEKVYNTFRGSRNLRGRSIHVTEYLYLLEMR